MSCKIYLLFIFISVQSFYQAKTDPKKTEKFLFYQNQINTSSRDIEANADQLLANAQTPYEIAFANFIKGSNRYREAKYLQSIYYYEAASHFIKGLDSIDFQRHTINMLVLVYRRAGLKEQSNEAWKQEQVLIQKSKNKYKEAERLYNLSKIYDIDEEYCKAAQTRIKYLKLVPAEIQKKDSDFIFAVYVQLAFAHIKCGDYKAAKKNIEIATDLLDTKQEKNTSSLLEIFYLSQALILINDNKINEAKIKFDDAYNESKFRKTNIVTKLILSERLDANIDGPNTQIVYAKEIASITKFETESTQQLAKYEINKAKTKLYNQNYQLNIWIIICISSFIILSIVIYLYQNKNRKQKKIFNDLIEQLKNKKLEQSNAKLNNLNKSEDLHKSYPERQLEHETKIVQQLQQLEEKHFYTSKGLSAAQMAVLLKISPRNLSYILRKYRDDDFYNYLNKNRIEYIIIAIKENPILQNYKISVLAEMCGYKSYSQFATNFKLHTNLSPTQFIQFLQNQKE